MSRNRRLGVACRGMVTGSRAALGAICSCASALNAIRDSDFAARAARCVGGNRCAAQAPGIVESTAHDDCTQLARHGIGRGAGTSLQLRK
jgi:hypothetical protein